MLTLTFPNPTTTCLPKAWVPEIYHLHLPPFSSVFCIILPSEVKFYPQASTGSLSVPGGGGRNGGMFYITDPRQNLALG